MIYSFTSVHEEDHYIHLSHLKTFWRFLIDLKNTKHSNIKE
tara:strand:- start:479 stop:601 length:123 start_codon:yes stop_codon:yes gene_type:complete